MARNKLFAALVLLPLSKVYGLATGVRNLMFRWHILSQREFPVPVVVVGNIGVGGTGKTPHTEYILEQLKYKYHIAWLSRGYRRRTRGFVLATDHSTPRDIGDEAYQVYQKFGRQGVTVAVCEDRCAGIDEMLRIDPAINLVVLDDAFQHRYVKPTVAVVLTEFNRPVFDDYLLPYGRLRESRKAIYRADMVVVTKCPPEIKAIEYRLFKSNLNLYPYQALLFSAYDYGPLTPLFPKEAKKAAAGGRSPHLAWLGEGDSVLCVTGIDNPRPFVRYLRRTAPDCRVRTRRYPDHHHFTRRDMQSILAAWHDLSDKGQRLVVTTEKDAVRLANNPYFPPELRAAAYYVPVTVKFDPRNTSSFDEELLKRLNAHPLP